MNITSEFNFGFPVSSLLKDNSILLGTTPPGYSDIKHFVEISSQEEFKNLYMKEYAYMIHVNKDDSGVYSLVTPAGHILKYYLQD